MDKPLKKDFSKKLRFFANALTVSRALAGLPIAIALSFDQLAIAWLFILLAGLSDLLDGWIARKADGGNKFGAFLDPLSDKILILAPLIWLGSANALPIWAIWLLLTRELVVSSWRSHAPGGGPASFAGKSKTTLQYLSILLMLWPNSWEQFTNWIPIKEIGFWLFWPSLVLAYTSGFKYFKPQSDNRPS